MRGHFARVLLAGLLASSLQAGFCRAANTTAAPSQSPTPAAQAQQLLPATLALLQSVELSALARGRVLTPGEMRIARRLGVMQPERVRVLVSPVLPSWMAPDVMKHDTMANALAANVAIPDARSPAGVEPAAAVPAVAKDVPPERRYGVAGITAGHGILLGIRHANDPRVLAHELAHVAQYERLGVRAFALRYLTELLSVGYFRAPLELQADAAMRRVLMQSQSSLTQ